MLLITSPAIAETTVLSLENPSIFDAVSGNSVNTVTIDQAYQIKTDLANPQTTEQEFAYTGNNERAGQCTISKRHA